MLLVRLWASDLTPFSSGVGTQQNRTRRAMRSTPNIEPGQPKHRPAVPGAAPNMIYKVSKLQISQNFKAPQQDHCLPDVTRLCQVRIARGSKENRHCSPSKYQLRERSHWDILLFMKTVTLNFVLYMNISCQSKRHICSVFLLLAGS